MNQPLVSGYALYLVMTLGFLGQLACADDPEPPPPPAGDCELPLTGTTPAPTVVMDALGVSAYRWDSGLTGERIEVDAVDDSGATLASFVLESANRTINYFGDGADGEGAITGPIVATLTTADGEEVSATVTSKAIIPPGGTRTDPDDPERTIQDINEASVTQEITYAGRTLFVDERFSELGGNVLSRQFRVLADSFEGEPEVGELITVVEPGETENSLPNFVEYWSLTFDPDDTDNPLSEATVQQWFDEVDLREWSTASAMRLFFTTLYSQWQLDLSRELFRCYGGDEAVDALDARIGSIVSPLLSESINAPSCVGAVGLGIVLIQTAPQVGTAVAAGGIAGLLPLLAFGGGVYATLGQFEQCLCTDATGAQARESRYGCAPICSDDECENYCHFNTEPTCGEDSITFGNGECVDSTAFFSTTPTRICECYLETFPIDEGTASSCADPHIDTFDGRAYSPQVAGEFILAESTAGSPLMLQVRQEPYGDGRCSSLAINTAFAAEMGGQSVFLALAVREVRVDGEIVPLAPGRAIGFSDGSGVERRDEEHFYFYFSDGSIVTVRATFRLDIVLTPPSASRAGEFRGLLGTLDGDVDNELALRNGTVLEYPVSFEDLSSTYADSWRISAAESLMFYAPGESTDMFSVPGFPNGPARVDELSDEVQAEAERVCTEAGVTGTLAMRDCILDVGCTGDDGFASGHLARSDERIPISQSMDLSGWTIEGEADPSSWLIGGGIADSARYRSASPVPALLVSDTIHDEFLMTWVTNNVGDASQGSVGLVFGYQSPLSASSDGPTDYDAWLLTWTSTAPSAFPDVTAPIGWTLVRLDGVIDASEIAQTFYAQQSTAEYQVIATGYDAGFGWVNRIGHDVRVVVRADRIEVTVITTGATTYVPLAVDVAMLGGEIRTGRVGFLSLGTDLTRFAQVTLAPLL